MSSDAPHLTLASICTDVSYGYTESATPTEVGPKFLRITDIQGGSFDWSTVPFCPANDQNSEKYKLAIGDIVVARTGNSTGENAQIISAPPPAVFASYLIRFRPDANRINPFFLGYQLRTEQFRRYVAAVRGGSAQPGANAKQLGSFPIRWIERKQQDAVVRLLRALDDRITLLRETNKTLEAIAQAIFKSWFVDFDPVRAKMEGRQPEGMDEATAALFPDSFEESELGLIPNGFNIYDLGSICNTVDYVANGSFSKLKEKVKIKSTPDYALYIRTTDFNSNWSGDFRYVDKSAYEFLAKSALHDKDVIISNVGDVGTVFRPPVWLERPMTLGSNAVAIKSEKLASFLYFHFSSPAGQGQIKSIVTGSAQLKFNKTNFRALRICIPAEKILNVFESIAEQLLKNVDNNLGKLKTLSSLRDTLLPRLISGQLRLSEAQEQIENALT